MSYSAVGESPARKLVLWPKRFLPIPAIFIVNRSRGSTGEDLSILDTSMLLKMAVTVTKEGAKEKCRLQPLPA